MTLSASKPFLDLAARLALRAQGDVEPNPLVGAVIVKADAIIGRGHHRRYGGLHAETEALADCRARDQDPRGSTLYVTLEPCDHFGKQPPCTKAIIDAGIARVVIARSDPNPVSSGGAESLRRAGIAVEFTDVSPNAIRISDPFIKRITTGLPWVIAKWAQTPDGRMTGSPNESRWISNELSRRRVHRLRGRVDAILTGIGTVLADDPLLTARGVHVRRMATRVVLDKFLVIPDHCTLVCTARDVPLLVCTLPDAPSVHAAHCASLKAAGASVLTFDSPNRDRLHLPSVLKHLASQGATNILLEAGPRLVRSFLDQHLADELLIHVAPPPPKAPPAFAGYALCRSRPLGGDLELRYRRLMP